MKVSRWIVVLLGVGGGLGGGLGCDDGDDGPTTVTMSGVAYTFNTPDPIAGAQIHIVEEPDLVATTAADGSWSLEVPADAAVTPYVTHTGYVTMHLQTFSVGEEPIERVYFQMVTTELFDTLALVLNITPDPERCQLATTVSEKVIQTMTFAEFTDHGAHGVADATVALTPAAGAPTYFNEQVIPDASRTATSRDGGVVFTNLPVGTYTMHATHPTKSFADVTFTCTPGRFINANPPHGLREL